VSYEPPVDAIAAVAGRPEDRMTLTRGSGCGACRGTGFRGRVGLFELLRIDDEVRDAIATHASRAQLRECARRAGLLSLRVDGWQKVEAGLTTVEEVMRVVQS
jgi:type II secretory ATPase GspE/PulE/Tfp pilus assembly ATPase PilB-like protein